MVSYNLKGRKAKRLRNPGYTCGNNNGKVVVDIKVAQSGEVVFAKYNTQLSVAASVCMIEKAESYAKRSKFNYSATASKTQTGTITYTFIYRK
jgi:hypothetical protein